MTQHNYLNYNCDCILVRSVTGNMPNKLVWDWVLIRFADTIKFQVLTCETYLI